MSRLFAAIGVAALVAGAASWVAMRPARSPAQATLGTPEISAAAILATSFDDGNGRSRSLAEFPGKVLVVNFWATWCAPCRAEMPAFDRLHARWTGRGVQFVGLSAEPRELATDFGRTMGIRYPLWTATGQTVPELSRRLGNRLGVLPHTVVFDATGSIVDQRVGPYTESELDELLHRISAKSA
jgi:thiol-disulfide isomerase/thioredoxin